MESAQLHPNSVSLQVGQVGQEEGTDEGEGSGEGSDCRDVGEGEGLDCGDVGTGEVGEVGDKAWEEGEGVMDDKGIWDDNGGEE